MDAPQVIMIALFTASGMLVLKEHGFTSEFWGWIAGTAIQFGLMYWGGFFG